MDFRTKAKETMESIQQKADKTVGILLGRPADLLDEEEAATLRQRIGTCALWGVIGFLFQGATTLYSARPLGIALLLAGGRTEAIPALVGAILAAVFKGEGGVADAIILAMVLGARILLSLRITEEEEEPLPIFGEPLRLRVAVALFAAFLAGVYRVVVYEFHPQGILALLFGIVAAPLLTALFWSGLQKEQSPTLREAGLCGLLFCAVYALGAHSLFGLSPAIVVTCIAVLQGALKGGLIRGGALGLLCGVAAGIPPLLPAAGGAVAGALRMFGAGSAVFCFFAVTGGLAIWQGDLWSALPLLGNLLFGILLFLPLARSGLLGKLTLAPASTATEPTCEADRHAADAVKLRRLSASFDDLSKTLLKLTKDLSHPDSGEMLDLCEEVFRRHCKKCIRNRRCWQDDYESTQDAICKLAEDIPRKGSPSRSSLPAYFVERCKKIDEILADVGTRVAEHVEGTVLRDRSELFALDYQALAALLRDVAADDGNLLPDEELRKTFAAVIRGEGVRVLGCGAWGTGKKLMIASGVTLSTIPAGGRSLRHKLEEKTGLALTEPSFKFVGESVSMQFESRHRFKLATARACSVKESEPVSGDTARSFASDNGCSYTLICDGMGSGRAAASTAAVASLFLEKLLSGGNRKSVTLRLLSNFIRGRAEECHCTVDLLEMDLYTGAASFVKCGACPSYVLREGNIYKIDVRSMPLGLTREINAQQINMALREGDVILQVSDGVAGSLEEALWLPEVFASLSGKSVQEIAGAIHSRTISEKGRGDDITVLVTKVEKA